MRKIFISYSYGDYKSKDIAYQLRIKLEELGHHVSCPHFDYSNLITDNIWDYIKNSSLVIAIITSEEANPNIFLEVGYSLGIGKQLILVTDYLNKLPFDLQSIYSIKVRKSTNETVYDIINKIESNMVQISMTENMIEKDFSEIINLRNRYPESFERISAKEFEQMVFNIFVQNGYQVEEAHRGKDYGFDFFIRNYKSYDSVIVEVKKYNINSKVSIAQIQKFLGALYDANVDMGIFISSSGYTSSAVNFAKRHENLMQLWDMNDLTNNLKTDSRIE